MTSWRRRLRCALAIVAVAGLTAGCGATRTPPPEPEESSLVYEPPAELPAPESVVATSGQYREIPLRWDPVLLPDVAGYLIESSQTREGPFLPREALANRGSLAWVDRDSLSSPLGDDATRFYRLRSFGHDGRVSSFVSGIAVATTAALPDPPEGLFAYSRQPRSVPLAWRASDDPIVAGYTVERSPGPEGPFEVVAELEGRQTTHLLDEGLGDLRVLFYRVSSRNPGGQRGVPSEVVRAVTKPEPLPPIGLQVEGRRLGEIALAWEPNVERDLLGYRLLRRRRDGPLETVTYIGADETRAVDPALGASEVVAYQLVAVDRDGLESRPSEPVAGRSVGYAWHVTASAAEVTLRWNPRSDEGYTGARITRSSGLWTTETWTTDGSEWIDRDVTPGRTYRYRIALLHEDGGEAPASRPAVVAVPGPGEPFVEIQAPASILPPPEGIPR